MLCCKNYYRGSNLVRVNITTINLDTKSIKDTDILDGIEGYASFKEARRSEKDGLVE
jgi:hypothetical protein